MGQHKDFWYKFNAEMIKNHDTIYIVDLNTKVRLFNHKLVKNFFDVSWLSFVTKLQYRAGWCRQVHGKIR